MKSTDEMLRLLQERRREVPDGYETLELGKAVAAVLDEFIAQVKVIAHQPAGHAPLSLRKIREMPNSIATYKVILNVLSAMDAIVLDGTEAIMARYEPLMAFLNRVGSQGYEIADDLTVIDTHQWSVARDQPDLLVQLEAEKIARDAQTAAYQERITHMATALEDTGNDYAQRVRALITPTPDTD